jgi:hypothetical protein
MRRKISLSIFLNSESNVNIEKRHREKSDKYAHFVTDMTGYECAVTAFEIGRRGDISNRNHSALYSLFVRPGVELAKVKQNISALVTRKEEMSAEPHTFTSV